MRIIPADETRLAEWLAMRLALWPSCECADSRREIRAMLNSHREAAFLALDATGEAIGFAEVSTREYVDGCTTSPVGYLEGIYVRPAHRRRGVAAALVKAGEAWAAAKGCREMGSDAALRARRSIAFHQASGFRITERQVVFLKDIRKRRPGRTDRERGGSGSR